MTIDTEPLEGAEELVKRTEVSDTPFTIIETEGRVFGTFGQYRITEPSDSYALVEAELRRITWNRIVQIVAIIVAQRNKLDDYVNDLKED